MNVNDAPVIETDKLVLSAPLYGTHLCTSKRTQCAWGQATLQRGVKHVDPLDDRSLDGVAEDTDSSFDLWKFRHKSRKQFSRC
jgi:hypothetical protein